MEECNWEDWSVSDTSGITITCSATYFWKVNCTLLLKGVTKASLRNKKFWKFRFLGYFSESTTEDYKRKYWSARKRFEITIPSWATYLEVSAHISLKIARESFLEAKILRKFWFLGYFSKAKTEECDQNNWSDCDKFGMVISCSAAYFMEVGARISWKVAMKVFLEVK